MKDIQELIKALRHKDNIVQQDAAESLGKMRDGKAVDPLIQSLKDKNRFVRQEVVIALGRIGDTRAVEPLTHALKKEKDEFLKPHIEKALEKLQSRDDTQ